ncbi:MAG: lamin tail domain-containing protein [Myxococcota bacterium]|nr:lamin tail domain-containing protein [Myxococcota bacterium]
MSSDKFLFTAAIVVAFSACFGGVAEDFDEVSRRELNVPFIDAGPYVERAKACETRQDAEIIINEVASKGEPEDWVELYNRSSEVIDVLGFGFRDDNPEHAIYRLTDSATIAPGEYFVVELGASISGFGVGSDDAITLYDMTDLVVDCVDWLEGQSPEGGSFARLPNAGPNWGMTTNPTKGLRNIP